MTAKQYLNRARNLEREIYRLMEAREEENAKLTRMTQSLTGDTVQATRDPHKYDRYIILGETLDRAIDQLVDAKREIEQTIDKLDKSLYRDILRRRYIFMETFEQIAVGISYSYKQTCRLHGRALIEITRYINGE